MNLPVRTVLVIFVGFSFLFPTVEGQTTSPRYGDENRPSGVSQKDDTVQKQHQLSAEEASRARAVMSVRPHVSVARLADEVSFAKAHNDRRWTYLDAYLYWLRQRAYPRDTIDSSAYKAGMEQKRLMPEAQISGVPESARTASRWEFVGPRKLPTPYRQYYGVGFTSGRINGVAFDPEDKNTFFVTAAGGGLWQTKDRGKTWHSLSDSWIDPQVSAIQVDSRDHLKIYVGTGDFDGGRSIYGFGVMITSDGGKTWVNRLNQELSGYSVKDIVVYPEDSNIVLVTAGNNTVALGAIWRTTDGGLTWAQPQLEPADWQDIKCGAKTSNNTRLCYAVGAGIGGEVWRSEDAGATWSRLAPPASSFYQTSFSIATSPTDALSVYLLGGSDRTIWKSNDGGGSWVDITNDFPTGDNDYNWSQSDYDFVMTCSTRPDTGADVIYVGLIDIVASIDGGVHWRSVGQTYEKDALTHNDQHAMTVNPGNPNEMLIGNDGGVYLTTLNPANNTWTFDTTLNAELGLAQFYKADFHPTDPTQMIGGTQDNATPRSAGNLNAWSNVGAGDGGYALINPIDPKIQFATGTNLTIYRTGNSWLDWNPQHPDKSEITYYDTIAGDRSRAWLGDSTLFIAPIVFDLTNPNYLYAGTNYLWRWDDKNYRWEQHLGNQMLTAGVDDAITAIALTPKDDRRIYTGSQTGQVWISTDKGQSWNRIDNGASDLPKYWVTSIAVDPSDTDSIIVALSGTSDATGGHPGHLWKCVHASSPSRSWINIAGRFRSALPNVPVNVVVIDPANSSRIYVGTDIGFYVTKDGGVNWADGNNSLGLPNVQVNDLKIVPKTGYLMAATFGRGMWRIRLPLQLPDISSSTSEKQDKK